jgi:uncharacterized protein
MTHNHSLALAAALGATILSIASPTKAADFSCRDAGNAAERAICSDAKLSKLDDRLAVIYGQLWAASDGQTRLDMRSYQRKFLSARNACGWNNRCLHEAYLDQIGVLQSQLIESRLD